MDADPLSDELLALESRIRYLTHLERHSALSDDEVLEFKRLRRKLAEYMWAGPTPPVTP